MIKAASAVFKRDISSWNAAREAPNTKFRNMVGGGSGTNQLPSITFYRTTSSVFGINPAQFKNTEEFDSAVTADPLKQWFFRAWCFNAQPGAASAPNVGFAIELTYYVELFQQTDVGTS